MSASPVGTDTEAREIRGSPRVRFRSCRVTVTAGPDQGRTVETDRPLIRIGTAADNDLVLTDGAISRHHLALVKRGGEYVLLDEGSTNGTWVSHLRIKEAVVRNRGEIQLGDSLLLFEPLSSELELRPSEKTHLGPLVGRSEGMRSVLGAVERVSGTDLSVLLEGETGTGKSLIAATLHEHSDRADGPLVTFDCGALPSTLTCSALFGAPDGALAAGRRGTVVLDRVEALEATAQAELLSLITASEGAEGDAPLDVRFVSTSQDLGRRVDEGAFRPELYYRLAVVRIAVPPLRNRPEDLRDLVEAFFQMYPDRRRALEESGWVALRRHAFPGNVRELMNALHFATTRDSANALSARELGPALGREHAPLEALALPDARIPFKDAKAKVLDAFERRYLKDLLARNAQNISRAAREGGIDRRHLYRLLDKYGLDAKEG